VLLIAALPTLVTVASAWAGLWDASNLWRAALAIPLGVSLAAVIAAVAAGDLR
jgi:anti-sigma-K factor RskA